MYSRSSVAELVVVGGKGIRLILAPRRASAPAPGTTLAKYPGRPLQICLCLFFVVILSQRRRTPEFGVITSASGACK